MKQKLITSACAVAACLGLGDVQAQSGSAGESIVITAKRSSRVSKGATNLPLAIKDTPQSISTLERDEMADWGVTGSNDALRLATGINVDEWETNRTNFNARGFDVMLTQIDGLGMANDWGLTVGQLDTYLFERIEVIRGANGLLTGVGNASGTINYVRKRPGNRNAAEFVVSAGSYDFKRVAADVNRVLTEDGTWAGRLVVAAEDKDSHLRALHDRRGTLYGVIDGQIGDNGVLTLGFTARDQRQGSPLWGSLTLPRADGTLADFPTSASTSQDWTRWFVRSTSAFVEYAHTLAPDWEAKVTLNHQRGSEDVKLFYAYSLSGTLKADNTGLVGWPYRNDSESSSRIVDANLTGRFGAFGRKHELVLGLSHSTQKNFGESYDIDPASPTPALPAFPYAGNVYPEPTWTTRRTSADGEQQLTRLYAATRLALSDRVKGIAGLNAVSLKRDGTSIYGGSVRLDNEKTEKVSPYLGLTVDLTPNALAYVSYSDIFQAQDQRDVNGRFLPAMKGVNAEAGVKAEWLERRLLTTFALFGARQNGLATEAGFDTGTQQSWYEAKDVKARGFEFEATGRLTADTRLTAGYTQLRLTGPDGHDTYEWIPRKTFNLRADVRVLPALRLGGAARWQSDISKTGGARQDAYVLASAFAAYEISEAATLRLSINNLFDKTYLRTVAFGAIYGAPRNGTLALELKL